MDETKFGGMKKQDVAFLQGTEERILDDGELIKLRLEMVFQAISRKKQMVRMPLSERVKMLNELSGPLRN